MKQVGSVEVPQEAFMLVLNLNEEENYRVVKKAFNAPFTLNLKGDYEWIKNVNIFIGKCLPLQFLYLFKAY